CGRNAYTKNKVWPIDVASTLMLPKCWPSGTEEGKQSHRKPAKCCYKLDCGESGMCGLCIMPCPRLNVHFLCDPRTLSLVISLLTRAHPDTLIAAQTIPSPQ
ncbi:hypothetical protein J6590_021468, partial [Homalodisca vitripennis]